MLDAIVIGAGAAGLGAAAVLRAAGVERYLILEATGTIGGRVRSFSFGKEKLLLENGANWVSGAFEAGGKHRAVNPLFRLALAMNLSMVRVPGSATNMSNWEVMDEKGHWTDVDRARRDKANAVARCIATKSPTISNLSAADAAIACGFPRSPDGIDRSLEWQLFTGETGLPPQHMKAGAYLPDPTYDTFGADDFFVTDQRPHGFALLLDAVAAGALDGGASAIDGGRLVLNSTVTRIEYACDGARVVTADGRSWSTRHVISTLPLGVLQRRADELFTPRVPRKQMGALHAVSMSNYTKIFAQWEEAWWNTGVYKWAQANDGVNGGELGSVRNLAHPSVHPGSKTLLFDLGDPQSSKWEGLTDAEASALLLDNLRMTHPDVVIPPPIAFHMTRHSRDALSYGAYSAWGTSTGADHQNAAMPLATGGPSCAPRVWLSGEAFCPNFNGFVHGGLLAGRRDARRVLAALGKGAHSMLDGEDDLIDCDRRTTRNP